MTLVKRSRVRLLGAAAAMALGATITMTPALAADATNWPTQPVKLIVPFAPGGTSDVLAREIAARLQVALKQTVVVDNKAGAGGVLGADSVAKAAPDGYTVLLGTIATHAINPALMPKMPYKADRDFAPVILLGKISNVLLIGPGAQARTVKDIVAAAKAKPGDITFASAGQGTSQHLSGEVFRLMTGADLTHVPYKGSAPAIQDVMGGQVPMSFETVTVALPQIKAGKVKAVAVTSAKRSAQLPDVPTLAESGVPGFDVSSWQALYLPAGTPPAIVAKLNAEVQKIVAQPEVKAKMESLGLEYAPNTPAQFTEFQKAEQARWAKVIKDGNVKPD
ncbi:tripartite-type tricarboxylate transporter receptor subunit TctC [Mitsuaria sp. BK045]|jgi:tripartite-type tricarboxylate transporter receptor subunit TctC|uniref:tripartite tricarboxylate transporter substrate binding protein n=1 Tax=unclassified Roseateles TaxID=2626991 RepID=UPI0017BB9990|nr:MULTISPECIES: tripartite tricarboxylate transporter substrate binding protein [unclassified Roseateles]MBB3294322.1 tripartite-type tricarboxylate transporter receptor subunit TctC [Mitsuaria sp. BK041]MBB3363538.1 tripartite-type tricarboxylate transporter receptor subunit TctC [Mitsuaria sp. BK045]